MLHIDKITIHFIHDGASGDLVALVETFVSTQEERQKNKVMVDPMYVDVAKPPGVNNILEAVNEALVRMQDKGWRWRVWQSLTRGREGMARARRVRTGVASFQDERDHQIWLERKRGG
jgi:hypothetical protein